VFKTEEDDVDSSNSSGNNRSVTTSRLTTTVIRQKTTATKTDQVQQNPRTFTERPLTLLRFKKWNLN
jgi:hypothetical protein